MVRDMLDPTIRGLAQGKNFGALTVLLPSGMPMTHVMWVDADDDHVFVNTEAHRAKAKAMDNDPRVAVAIWDATSPYRYGEVRGTVVERITGPRAREHIDELARKYTGANYASPITSERVIYKIAPAHQHMLG
jgi:PPOX class probable F420-dependent enzyme